MSENQASRLYEMSRYTYGTTRLGDENIPFDDRVDIARAAKDAGVWFHTSHTYGNALQVLRTVFDEDREHIPPAIFKIGWDSIPQIREIIHQNIEPLGINTMAVGQLCLGGAIAEEFRTGGACYKGFQQLKEEGVCERLVLEVWPWNSHVALEALQHGYPDGVVDGYIFYLNPLQRFVSNDLWDLFQRKSTPIVAMRTVAGGQVTRIRDYEGYPAYLRERAAEVVPVYEQSGCKTWTEFCVRFALGFPQVSSTVGSTSHYENLVEFLDNASTFTPLPHETQDAIMSLQRKWYLEHDVYAEPWSM